MNTAIGIIPIVPNNKIHFTKQIGNSPIGIKHHVRQFMGHITGIMADIIGLCGGLPRIVTVGKPRLIIAVPEKR